MNGVGMFSCSPFYLYIFGCGERSSKGPCWFLAKILETQRLAQNMASFQKGSSKQSQSYRIVSLISHLSKVMVKVIQNHINTTTDGNRLASDQEGVQLNRSSTVTFWYKNIYNTSKIASTIFIDFKKAVDSLAWETVTHNAKCYQGLCKRPVSAVLNKQPGNFFQTTISIYQVSPVLFNSLSPSHLHYHWWVAPMQSILCRWHWWQ